MSLGRLFAILIGLVLAAWVLSKSGLLSKHEPEGASTGAPIERARAAAKTSAERDTAREAAQGAADSASGGAQITENMTAEQVRALLGPPSETRSETMDSGGTREKWIYSAVGKTVVFENGVVVSIQ
jgi:hypothetical protein